MSRKVALEVALAGAVRQVRVKEATEHGEPGEVVTVVGLDGRCIDVFLADDRKITEDHAVQIVSSHLHRIGVEA